jgi:hypothetical protein
METGSFKTLKLKPRKTRAKAKDKTKDKGSDKREEE